MIRWVRSMPDPMPPGRGYVRDRIPKFYHTNYDYTKLVGLNDEARLNLIEWDVAIGLEDYERWSVEPDHFPTRVRVAPVWHYDEPRHYVQRSCYYDKDDRQRFRYINHFECLADYSGFDLISFPQGYLRECLDWLKSPQSTVDDQRLTDTTFSEWMYLIKKESFAVDWTMRPVHLHYTIP